MIDLTECLMIDGRPDDPDSLTSHAARRFLETVASFCPFRHAGLFGSRARWDARPDSDLDIALLRKGLHAAFLVWLPSSQRRMKVNPAIEAKTRRCAALYGQETLDFGRVLGGEAGYYPQEVLLCEGAKPAELFHLRIT